MSTSSLILVISFDRLPVHALSCYGGVSARTPNLDRLAANGVVFDSHFLEDLGTDSPRHAWWSGRFEHVSSETSSTPNLFECLTTSGVETRVISHAAFPWPNHEAVGQFDFDDVELNEQLFHRGLLQLQEWRETPIDRPRLLWIHTPGDFNARQVETWEPLPHESGLDVEMAESLLRDQRNGIAWSEEQVNYWREWQRYRVTQLDREIGRVCDHVEQLHADATIIVTAAHGTMPVSSAITPECAAGFATSHVQTPLIVSGPQTKNAIRRRELTQAIDLPSTVLKILTGSNAPDSWDGRDLTALFVLDRTDSVEWDREAAYLGARQPRLFAVRTPYFYFTATQPVEEFMDETTMLFHLPDDPHGIHDISRQEPDVVDESIQKYREFRAACENSR